MFPGSAVIFIQLSGCRNSPSRRSRESATFPQHRIPVNLHWPISIFMLQSTNPASPILRSPRSPADHQKGIHRLQSTSSSPGCGKGWLCRAGSSHDEERWQSVMQLSPKRISVRNCVSSWPLVLPVRLTKGGGIAMDSCSALSPMEHNKASHATLALVDSLERGNYAPCNLPIPSVINPGPNSSLLGRRKISLFLPLPCAISVSRGEAITIGSPQPSEKLSIDRAPAP